jgi:predicted helicase
MTSKGTIYLRDNVWFQRENVIKMGIASSAKDRSGSYITGEVERGHYVDVYEVPLDRMRQLDNYLKNYFRPYHHYRGGGTEFYERSLIDMVEPYLQSLNIEYKRLSKEEIETMERIERLHQLEHLNKIKKFINKIKSVTFIHRLKERKNKKIYLQNNPNAQQQHVLDKIEEYYQTNNIGKLIWACGLGKALLSLFIVKLMKFKTVIIGVPSNFLQQQIKNEILKLFPNRSNICLVGGEGENGTNKIISFLLERNRECKFIVATYHSCYLLADEQIHVDFKIGDEAHHLVGLEKEEEKGFRMFHKISSTKSLFMTATEKTMTTVGHSYSMDDERIFGKYIDVKSVCWAIENKKITDYNILVLKNTEDEVDETIRRFGINVSNKDLFISSYMCLKSLEKYGDLTHLLLYTNKTKDAELALKYINEIIELNVLSIRREDIYTNALYSGSPSHVDMNNEVKRFKNAPLGIISCVYIFGEGFDLPKLTGVCIAGNMQSETRIVQYLLRPNRLEYENPTKKAYIIIPYIDSEDWKTTNNSYEKVRSIIYQMRSVDENIEQKLVVSVETKKEIKEKREEMVVKSSFNYMEKFDFEENSEELLKFKLRLRYSKALGSKFTEEQDEYNYVRSINHGLVIQSKKEYTEKRRVHSNFIENPEEYFKAKGVWTDWYDFMGVDTLKFIQSKQEWKNFCKEMKITTLDKYYEGCELYNVLPKEPADFYKDFGNITDELGLRERRRK